MSGNTMNKRGDKLLTLARKNTENEDFSTTSGIQDEELYQWLNDAQMHILSKITATHPKVFVVESPSIQVSNGQEEYSPPDDIFLENRIVTVEYSQTGSLDDLEPLDKSTLRQRDRRSKGYPSTYIRRSGKILLSPIPDNSTGIIRFNYQRRIAEISPRIGKVLTVTLDTSNKTITSLTIDPDQTNYNAASIGDEDHLCFIDVFGNQQMTKVQIDSIDENTGVLTVTSSFVYTDGETITVGDFVVAGYNATSHSELPKSVECFLIAYLVWKLLKRDSSEDHLEQRNELKSMQTTIIDSFAEPDDDINFLPIIDGDD